METSKRSNPKTSVQALSTSPQPKSFVVKCSSPPHFTFLQILVFKIGKEDFLLVCYLHMNSPVIELCPSTGTPAQGVMKFTI